MENNIQNTKVLIIGSGAAGYSAGIYAARANLEPILITGMQQGGQLTITTDVENYPGFANIIQGPWLMEQMSLQAKNCGTNIVFDEIVEVNFKEHPFQAKSRFGNTYVAQSVIIATGAQARWLGIGEENFIGKGVSGCATCDAAFYKNKNVLVIGGGNTAVEEALFLTNYVNKVTLVHRRDQLRAQKVLQNRLFKNPKIEVLWNHSLIKVLADDSKSKVIGALLQESHTKKTTELKTDGIFIAIGHDPASKIFENHVDIDEEGHIIVTPGTTFTSRKGVFAAGDVQDKVYRQSIVAAGSGCMAALDAEKFIQSLSN